MVSSHERSRVGGALGADGVRRAPPWCLYIAESGRRMPRTGSRSTGTATSTTSGASRRSSDSGAHCEPSPGVSADAARGFEVVLDCRMATWTGVGRYTTGLARALSRHRRHRAPPGHRCRVRTRRSRPARPRPSRRAHVVPTARRGVQAPVLAGGWARARSHRARAGPGCRRTARTSRRRCRPCIRWSSPCTTWRRCWCRASCPPRRRRIAYRWWNRRAVKVADHIITDATFTIGEIEQVFPAARGRITAIPLGVDDFASGPVGPLPEPQDAMARDPVLALDGLDSRPQGSAHAAVGVLGDRTQPARPAAAAGRRR